MTAVENYKSRFFSLFLIVGLIFGVLFYDFIEYKTGFSYTDEILVVVLCSYTLLVQFYRRKIEKYWWFLLGVFAFYLVYSFGIHSNVSSAIVQDAVVQIKPFLGFFCAYSVAPVLTNKEKNILRLFCFFAFVCLLYLAYDMDTWMGHSSRYASAATIVALLYLFLSEYTKNNVIVFIVLLALSLLSTRSKAYGFFIIASGMFLLFYYNKNLNFLLSVKNIIVISCLVLLAIYIAWHKIYFYFINGSSNIAIGEVSLGFARPVLYVGAWWILLDYFPFGSGFGSYATYFSAIHYSDIYYTYGLNYVYGLSEDFPDFLVDTFYPSLAQFGFAGIALFLYFWGFIIYTANKYKDNGDMEKKKLWVMVLCVVLFFLIESVADATFTQNRGVFMMVLLGLTLSKLKICKQATG